MKAVIDDTLRVLFGKWLKIHVRIWVPVSPKLRELGDVK